MPKKILVIEDEKELLELTRAVLQKKGFEAMTSDSSLAGLEIARKELPDLIILDQLMPEKDGYEIIKELKSNPQTKNIPVLMTSGQIPSLSTEEAYQPQDYLLKPFEIEDLLKKVNSLLF